MKKFFLSFFVVVISMGYVVYQYGGGAPVGTKVAVAKAPQTAQVPKASPPPPTPSPTPTPTPAPAPPKPTPTPPPAPRPTGQYNDGTFTGVAADAYYGFVQIKVGIQGGKLVTVDFLQYPNDRSTSRYINEQAMPLLKQEAIQAQSANVSGVSGASDTSMAFKQSLGDALAQAKI